MPTLEERERRLKALESAGTTCARLRAVMDLWAGLWAFPIEHAELLPSREGWLRAVEAMLEVETPAPAVELGQIALFAEVDDDEAEDAAKSTTFQGAAEEVSRESGRCTGSWTLLGVGVRSGQRV